MLRNFYKVPLNLGIKIRTDGGLNLDQNYTMTWTWNREEDHASYLALVIHKRDGGMGESLATKYIVYLFPARPLSHHQSPPRTKVRLHFCIHFSMMVRNLLIMFPNSSCQNIKWPSQRLKSTSFAIYCNVIEGELLLYFLLYKSVLISLQSVCHVRALSLFCFATTGKWEMEQF